jgi:hypothetical protein
MGRCGAVAAMLLVAVACGSITPGSLPEPEPEPEVGLFGERGISLFNLGNQTRSTGASIGVNAFLWRATLDTISFLPLASADPFGGVIITDWYVPPETDGAERFKLTVYILDQRLRADGVKVSVFRQVPVGGAWLDAAVNSSTATDLENAILTRAREMWLNAQPEP